MKLAAVLVASTLVLSSLPLAAAPCPTNCGHRGTGKSDPGAAFPENTLPSFEQAVIEGAEMIELDVVHSADGELVVIHDDTVDRTSDGTGCVGDLTVAELQALDAGFGTAMEGQGVVIPTLAEVLAVIDVPVNVELKIDDGAGCPASDKPRMAANLIAVVEAAGARDRVVSSSFDETVLSELKALDPSFYAGFLTFAAGNIQLANDRGFDALNVLSSVANEAIVEQVHGSGLELNVWTENDPARMEALLDIGVDMIITDEPNLYAEIQALRCSEPPAETGASSEDDGGCALRPLPRNPGRWPLAAAALALALGVRRRPRS